MISSYTKSLRIVSQQKPIILQPTITEIINANRLDIIYSPNTYETKILCFFTSNQKYWSPLKIIFIIHKLVTALKTQDIYI